MKMNGCVPVGNTDMYYVAFGTGKKKLVVLPGLFEENKDFYDRVLEYCEREL